MVKYVHNQILSLQGGAQFPTGGIARERKLNRFDSGADSIVWMEEVFTVMFRPSPECILRAFLR